MEAIALDARKPPFFILRFYSRSIFNGIIRCSINT